MPKTRSWLAGNGCAALDAVGARSPLGVRLFRSHRVTTVGTVNDARHPCGPAGRRGPLALICGTSPSSVLAYSAPSCARFSVMS